MTHGVLLLDGGLGQELIRRSPSPAHHHWSLQVMLEQPNLVAEVHRDFCNAGAKVACLNTYGITRARLRGAKPASHRSAARSRARAEARAASNNVDTAMIASYTASSELPARYTVAP